jgi:glycosyltransferase involved in cell wall biosynthesis
VGFALPLKAALRLLVLLPQLPDDPASGAARTVTTIAGLMAAAGFEVEAIATTANEGYHPFSLAESLSHLGVREAREQGPMRFVRRGVVYSLLDSGGRGIRDSMHDLATEYDGLVDEALARFRPHVVLTYGGSAREVERQRRVRAAGPKVVFGLYNMRYFTPGFLDHVDAVITPTEFLSARYREVVNLQSVPLPGPLWPEDVIAEQRRPRGVAVVNPTLDKGLMVFVAIAKLLAEQQPSIPIDIFTTRDSERSMRQAAFLAGVDLGRAGVSIHGSVSSPRRIYEDARTLLVPSLFEDPAPRVIAEAFVNGVIPIGSDRGGIPEMCDKAGVVIPIPRTVDPTSFNRVPAEVAQPWVDHIALLASSGTTWRRAVTRGYRAAESYLPPATTHAYGAFFRRLANTYGR